MIEALVRRAQMLAAVSGKFAPQTLIDAVDVGQQTEDQGALVKSLSGQVSEVVGEPYCWHLLAAPRRSALMRLRSQAQAERLIERAPPLAKEDRTARLLRRLLRQDIPSVESNRHKDTAEGLSQALLEMGQLLEAAQYAQAVPYLDADKLGALIDETKRMITMLQRRRDMMVLLPQNHVGYEQEREELSAYLRGADSPFDAPKVDSKAPTWTDDLPVFVSGIGGVGKSALMARLFQYWQRRKGEPLTIVLDFDRRQLNKGSPEELYREFLRQAAIGISHKGLPPEQTEQIVAGLNALRSRYVGASATDTGAADHQSQQGYLFMQLGPDFGGDWAAPLRELRIALIFDSFESMDRRGGTSVSTVLEFEETLRQRAQLNIRSVFSGREAPLDEASMVKQFGPKPRRRRLTGLHWKDGADLLRQADRVEAQKRPGRKPLLPWQETRRKITEALKNHPLTLLLAVRFIHTHPDALNELVKDFDAHPAFQAEVAQVFLYTRILDRIDDAEVRGLAHPGLVLRHVDADLIRYVLAGPCLDMDHPPSPQEAERLRLKLREEYWLVEPIEGQEDGLSHRGDLRAKMLPVLFAGPTQKDSGPETTRKKGLRQKAISVALGAERYYQDGPPIDDAAAHHRWSKLSRSFRQAHSLYYGALARPLEVPTLDTETARLMRDELTPDEIENLPPAWKSSLQALIGEAVDDVSVLSEDLKEKAEADRYQAEQAAGRLDLSLGPKAARAPSDPQELSAAQLEREISTHFAQAQFEAVAPLAASYFSNLESDSDARARLAKEMLKGFWNTPAWQAILSTEISASGSPNQTRDPLFHLPGSLKSAIGAFLNREMSGLPGLFFKRSFLGKALIGTTLDTYRFAAENYWPKGSLRSKRTVPAQPLVGRLEHLALAVSGYPEQMEVLSRHAPEIAGFVQELWSHKGGPSAPKDPTQAKPISLRTLSRLYSAGNRQGFELDSGALAHTRGNRFIARMFRGVTPELYAPLTQVLSDAPQDVLTPLYPKLRKKARFWPDLVDVPTASVDDAFWDHRVLVETVDRVGLMRLFLYLLIEQGVSEVEPIARIHDVITGWFFPSFRKHL